MPPKKLRDHAQPTRESILDAAEALFSDDGFHGTSMRDLERYCGVPVALITYHYKTKENLFEQVIQRRAAEMKAARLALLRDAKAQAGARPIPIEQLLNGYIWPFIERSSSGDKGWKNYSRLIARAANSPEWSDVISRHYDEVALKYIDELRQALPTKAEKDLYKGFYIAVSAMIGVIAEPGRLERLSQGAFDSQDLLSQHEVMIPFLAAGFHSLPDVQP